MGSRGARGGGPRVDRQCRRTGPPRGRCRTRGPHRDRRGHDRARDVRRMDPGRPRARPRLFDHGRRRRHHPRARGARDRGMDPGPGLDPRIRRRAQRLRRVVCGDPGDVLDRPARRPAGLGAALATPRRDARARDRGKRRPARVRGVGRPLDDRPPALRGTVGQPAARRAARPDPLLRAAARDRPPSPARRRRRPRTGGPPGRGST